MNCKGFPFFEWRNLCPATGFEFSPKLFCLCLDHSPPSGDLAQLDASAPRSRVSLWRPRRRRTAAFTKSFSRSPRLLGPNPSLVHPGLLPVSSFFLLRRLPWLRERSAVTITQSFCASLCTKCNLLTGTVPEHFLILYCWPTNVVTLATFLTRPN